MNPISKLKFFLGPGMFQHTINLSILAIICWVALIQFPEWEFLGYPLWDQSDPGIHGRDLASGGFLLTRCGIHSEKTKTSGIG